MAFLLLLFFLVINLVAQLSKKEETLSIPTPKNEPGRAQILIQVIDKSNYLYMDQTVAEIVKQVKKHYGFRPQNIQNQLIIKSLINNKMDQRQLLNRLSKLVAHARSHPRENSFILIRCPNNVYYFYIIKIIQEISGIPNLKYGCVGGSLSDIQKASKIDIRKEKDKHGKRRENLYISF